MKIALKSFADVGIEAKERIVMRVDSDHDIGKYVLLCTAKGSEGKPTWGKKEAYWFPDKPLKAGDQVVLYSKAGTRSEKKLDDGSTVHFFYWGLSGTRWGDGKNMAVLVQGEDWHSKAP
ncbi:hypothetical protein [Burkholderia sp. GS2Y]|uniref:Uncharacterized protein n=1 Tax=Burkholderia theae TaxID=3143496 RepID=A0ABU9WNC1_9BURK